MLFVLPDGPCEYALTEEFKMVQFPKGRPEAPKMLIEANTPGEAILRFKKYYRIGKEIGAYK